MVKFDSEFKKSTYSKHEQYGDGNCVEVKRMDDIVLVRDSKDRKGAVLKFTKDEWIAFIKGVKENEFDM